MFEEWGDELDVTSWKVNENIALGGTREKRLITAPDGELWIRKSPKPSKDPQELAIEAIALRIARASGLEAPSSHVVTWRKGDGVTATGIVVKNFLADGEELSHGNQLLPMVSAEYDPNNRSHHTLSRVHQALQSREGSENSLAVAFARLIAFDAWLGIGDRHQENWGIVRTPGRPEKLAPAYDLAACLGSELHDGNQILARGKKVSKEYLEGYIERCSSGFGDGCGGKLLLSQRTVLAEIGQWPEWRENIGMWIAGFSLVEKEVDVLLVRVPERWLSLERRFYARALLKARLDWLRSLA